MLNSVKITAHPTYNTSICSFNVEGTTFTKKIFTCRDNYLSSIHPLTQQLFSLPGIREVMVSQKSITLAKTPEAPAWKELGKNVGIILRELIEQNKHFIDDDTVQIFSRPKQVPHSSPSPSTPRTDLKKILGKNLDSSLAKKIIQILDKTINPTVASHGGKISLAGLEQDKAYVKMEGGCQGCGMAAETLRQGVEKVLLESVSEIKHIIDITDHQSGESPYYQS